MDPFILFMIVSAVVIVVTFSAMDWSLVTNFKTPKIKFTSFKKFYGVNPDRWSTKGGNVYCKIDICEYETFHLGYLDFYRYQVWVRKLKKTEQQKQFNESTKRMMDVVRQDIAESKAKSKATFANLFDDLANYAKQHENDELDITSLIEEYKKIYERKNL